MPEFVGVIGGPPRSSERGPVEASQYLIKSDAAALPPRSSERGPVEAELVRVTQQHHPTPSALK